MDDARILVGRRLLIVEDEALVSLLIEQMAEELGLCVVGIATSVAQGVSHTTEMKADIAILDVNLRGEHSFVVADILKQSNTPFIFATGYDTSEIPLKYQRIPKLTKPFNINSLKGALVQVMRSSVKEA